MDRGRGNVKQLLSKGLTSVDRRKRGAPRHGRIAGQERHRETLVSSRTAVHTLSPEWCSGYNTRSPSWRYAIQCSVRHRSLLIIHECGDEY